MFFFSFKILPSDLSDLLFHIPMNIIATSLRPLHSDWLCVVLLSTTCAVTVTLFVDKTNDRGVILF